MDLRCILLVKKGYWNKLFLDALCQGCPSVRPFDMSVTSKSLSNKAHVRPSVRYKNIWAYSSILEHIWVYFMNIHVFLENI
jgi:hypothetical protein